MFNGVFPLSSFQLLKRLWRNPVKHGMANMAFFSEGYSLIVISNNYTLHYTLWIDILKKIFLLFVTKIGF